MRPLVRSLLAAVVALLLAVPLPAQMPTRPGADDPAPRWRGEALTLGVNAVLGGLTSGVMRHARGGSFRRGFAAGAAGGALAYGGKRLSAEAFFGAGLLGRQVAAVGSSVTSNVAGGDPALARVVLPLGPVRVYLLDGARHARARLDLASTVMTAAAALHPDNRFDAEASLSAGAPVFQRAATARDAGWNGLQAAGVILVRYPPGDLAPGDAEARRISRTEAHERIHVLQYDQTFLLWAAPVERWALSQRGWTRALNRYVDLGLHVPVWAGLNTVIPYEDRPWEREAFFLSRTGPEHEHR